MTTSDPQADRRDDDSREHRSIGQRIRDAVLGDPADERRDAPADAGYGERREGAYADPRTGGEPGSADPADTNAGYPEAPHGDTSGAAGYTESGRSAEEGAGGYVAMDTTGGRADRTATDPDRTDVDQGYAERTGTDRADTDRGYAGSAGADRGGAEPGYADRTDVERGYADPAGRGATEPGYADRTDADREYAPYEQAMREHAQGGAVPDPVRDDVAQDGAPRAVDDRDAYAGRDVPAAPDTGRAEGVYTDTRADARTDNAPGDRDFATSSYDPDRDTGYDPQAAGTAVSGRGAAGVAADRATGQRDADYDTGRVDTGERDTRPTAGARTAGAVAAGGAAAAGVPAVHHRQDDRGDTRFSEVDDTATVDPTPTGRATPDSAGTAADRRAEAVADDNSDESEGGRERLVPADRAQDYSSRWDALKGDFVDEPRRAVAQADDLVGELLDEIQRLFSDQRRDLEQGFDHDRASTEDLRLALRRYRSFFDRLLSF